MENEVELFYDDFSVKQVDAGISKRNIKIQYWAEKFGLKPTDKVLEIGCGIGTQTELLAQYLLHGKVTAIDISPKSIAFAKQRLQAHKNVELLTGDITQMNVDALGKFNVIVLPDVIEHIPLELHVILFKKLRGLIQKDGFVLINIPNPNYLQWCHQNHKEALQIIDQPVYTHLLCAAIYPNDFYIHYLNTYEIWRLNGDYQVIVLKIASSATDFPFKYSTPTLTERIRYKLKKIMGLKK